MSSLELGECGFRVGASGLLKLERMPGATHQPGIHGCGELSCSHGKRRSRREAGVRFRSDFNDWGDCYSSGLVDMVRVEALCCTYLLRAGTQS